jgi:hypothetical protein
MARMDLEGNKALREQLANKAYRVLQVKRVYMEKGVKLVLQVLKVR